MILPAKLFLRYKVFPIFLLCQPLQSIVFVCRCFEDKYMECMPFDECSLIIPPFKKSYILSCLVYIFLLVPWPITMYSLIFIKVSGLVHLFSMFVFICENLTVSILLNGLELLSPFCLWRIDRSRLFLKRSSRNSQGKKCAS